MKQENSTAKDTFNQIANNTKHDIASLQLATGLTMIYRIYNTPGFGQVLQKSLFFKYLPNNS